MVQRSKQMMLEMLHDRGGSVEEGHFCWDMQVVLAKYQPFHFRILSCLPTKLPWVANSWCRSSVSAVSMWPDVMVRVFNWTQKWTDITAG